MLALEAVVLKLYAKLALGWGLIQVNFEEIGPKVGGGCSFVSGRFVVRLWYIIIIEDR